MLTLLLADSLVRARALSTASFSGAQPLQLAHYLFLWAAGGAKRTAEILNETPGEYKANYKTGQNGLR
jgi:hypothetical protein